jgi:hypothetical protein
VIANRANDARIAAALSDVEALANAQERFQIDVGYFVRMHALDDLPITGDGIANTDLDVNDPNVIDSIFDNRDASQDFTYQNPQVLFINPTTQDYVSAAQQNTILGVDETSFRGNGPYINWQRMRDINENDWPDDPWGNDYMLFTRAGVIIPTNKPRLDNGVQQDRTGSDDDVGGFWDDRSFQFEEEGPEAHDPNNDGINQAIGIFDRPVILSLGPDGLPGNGDDPDTRYGEGDDIYRAFGGARSGFNRLGGTGL